MALIEQDREDLFRDGRAMPIRGEIVVDSVTWLVGFRPAGQASVYAGANLVFQFTEVGELRRVYDSGERFAAENGRLQRLETGNRGVRLSLVRIPLSDPEQTRLLNQLSECLESLNTLANAALPWRTQGLEAAEFLTRVSHWITTRAMPPRIASSPGAREDA